MSQLLKLIAILLLVFGVGLAIWAYGWRLNPSFFTGLFQQDPSKSIAFILTRQTVAAPKKEGILQVSARGDVQLSGMFLEQYRARSGQTMETVAAAKEKARTLGIDGFAFLNRSHCLDAFVGTISIAHGPFFKTITYAECPDEDDGIRAFRQYLLKTFTETRIRP